MDGGKPRRKGWAKQAKVGAMDQTVHNAGKRGADGADVEEPPPPKCLTLAGQNPALPENFDLTKGDGEQKDPAKVKVPDE